MIFCILPHKIQKQFGLGRPLQKTQVHLKFQKVKVFFTVPKSNTIEQGDDIMIVACHAWLS